MFSFINETQINQMFFQQLATFQDVSIGIWGLSLFCHDLRVLKSPQNRIGIQIWNTLRCWRKSLEMCGLKEQQPFQHKHNQNHTARVIAISLREESGWKTQTVRHQLKRLYVHVVIL